MSFMAAMAMNAGGVEYRLSSPDGHITATIDASDRLTWSVERDGVVAFAPSQLGLTLSDGSVVGERVKVKRASRAVSTAWWPRLSIEPTASVKTITD